MAHGIVQTGMLALTSRGKSPSRSLSLSIGRFSTANGNAIAIYDTLMGLFV